MSDRTPVQAGTLEYPDLNSVLTFNVTSPYVVSGE